jgi:uncharacterized protein YndB with AHSA1/START domain
MSDNKNLIAKVSTTVAAPISQVWQALVTPKQIKEYMFGTNVVSDWQEGSSIVWKGEWEGKPYEDKGEILKLEKEKRLQYSHFSPLSGEEDRPENYHNVTIELEKAGDQTEGTLTQDKNENEEVRQHSEENWQMMLDSLKKFIEA